VSEKGTQVCVPPFIPTYSTDYRVTAQQSADVHGASSYKGSPGYQW